VWVRKVWPVSSRNVWPVGAALVIAEEALLAHHPVIDDLDDALYDGALLGDSPPLDAALVPILIARFNELHHLLGRCHVAVRLALLAPNDDFPV
jgi:hypothetical protein